MRQLLCGTGNTAHKGVSSSVRNARLLYLSVAVALLLLAGCGERTVKPSKIANNDSCAHCKTPINNVGFSAEFVTKTGFPRKFDDIACLIAYAKKVGRKNIIAYYMTDYPSQQLLPVEQVSLVRCDQFRTPQNGRIIAYQDAAKAKDVVARYQAEIVTIDDLIR